MRLPGSLVALALALGACAAPRPFGEGVALHSMLYGGYRAVDDQTFEGHPAYGIDLVTRDPKTGWGYELGGSYGTEDAGGAREHSAEFEEYSLGLRRSWRAESSARPYLGFGGSFAKIDHTLHSPHTEFEAEGGAGYVRGGVLWALGRYDIDRSTEILVGFDVRGMLGDDYDYGQLALVLAFGK